MTLILTAICKEGVGVCADKRYKIKGSSGAITYSDNNKKIYKFRQIPLIIINHGVNKFSGRYWDDFCAEYEKSDRWVNDSFSMIISDFKGFIEKEIQDGLNSEKLLSPDERKSGFLLCGKTFQDSKFKVKELFWSLDAKDPPFQSISHDGLIRSGIGSKYIERFIQENNALKSTTYWKGLKIDELEKGLKQLFQIAVKEKNMVGGDEFSDDYSFDYVVE